MICRGETRMRRWCLQGCLFGGKFKFLPGAPFSEVPVFGPVVLPTLDPSGVGNSSSTRMDYNIAEIWTEQTKGQRVLSNRTTGSQYSKHRFHKLFPRYSPRRTRSIQNKRSNELQPGSKTGTPRLTAFTRHRQYNPEDFIFSRPVGMAALVNSTEYSIIARDDRRPRAIRHLLLIPSAASKPQHCSARCIQSLWS